MPFFFYIIFGQCQPESSQICHKFDRIRSRRMPATMSCPPGLSRARIFPAWLASKSAVRLAHITSHRRRLRTGSRVRSWRRGRTRSCTRFLRALARLTRMACGIEIKGLDGRVAQFGGGDGEDAGPGADVQKGLARAGAAAGGQLFQAKGSGGMMAGAETQPGVQPHHPLAGTRAAAAPARFDEQSAADFHRLEMALPRLRPIFARQPPEENGGSGPGTTAAARGPARPAPAGASGAGRTGNW